MLTDPHLPVHVLGAAAAGRPTESDPLLPDIHHQNKPFYRARPLWLVPFAIAASLVRGMTLAPRVEVYTQLSCLSVYGHAPTGHYVTYLQDQPHVIPAYVTLETLNIQRYTSPSFNASWPMRSNHPHKGDGNGKEYPLIVPRAPCTSDPVVQSATARLQTLTTTIMGVLSALTTAWWGHFGERYGRASVLALSTLAFLLTDLTFLLVSIPSSLSQHGYKLLLIAPVFEGLFGGYGTLQSATSAYISDCTSPGSRSQIFSRFAGVAYLGIAIGPSIGGWLIRHPFSWARGPVRQGMSQGAVTSVFLVAMICSFLNIILVVFVLPESLSKERRDKAREEYVRMKRDYKGKTRSNVDNSQSCSYGGHTKSRGATAFRRIFGPLTIFLPSLVYDPNNMRRKKDWSLTILALGLFVYYLSQGVYQLKYLYAEHTYSWGAEQLSYYISFLGGTRALFLLFALPSIISIFKPGSPKGNKTPRNITSLTQGLIVERVPPSMSPVIPPTTKTSKKGKKGIPMTRPLLAKEISFDLNLAKFSLIIEMMSVILITLVSTPAYTSHIAGHAGAKKRSRRASEMLFVMASSLSCFGSGVVPSTQSLALCILQMRNLGTEDNLEADAGAGSLFGALAVLQAIGSTVLQPILFGLVYSETVAKFPKAVFVLAAAILFIGLVLLVLIGNPSGTPGAVMRDRVKKGKAGRSRRYVDVERGRSRVSKDLRGGAIPNVI